MEEMTDFTIICLGRLALAGIIALCGVYVLINGDHYLLFAGSIIAAVLVSSFDIKT